MIRIYLKFHKNELLINFVICRFLMVLYIEGESENDEKQADMGVIVGY